MQQTNENAIVDWLAQQTLIRESLRTIEENQQRAESAFAELEKPHLKLPFGGLEIRQSNLLKDVAYSCIKKANLEERRLERKVKFYLDTL